MHFLDVDTFSYDLGRSNLLLTDLDLDKSVSRPVREDFKAKNNNKYVLNRMKEQKQL